jgi:hypothetical protein
MAGARHFLLCSKVTPEILSLRSDWSGRTVWIAKYGCDSRDLATLEARGAEVASLTLLDYIDGQSFLAEGSDEAVSTATKIFSSAGAHVIGAPRGAQPWFEGARILGGTAMVGNLQAATDCLRAAGLALDDARTLVQHLALRALRSHQKAGHKAWKQPSAEELRRILDTLQGQCPPLHRYLRETVAASAELQQKRPAQGFGLGGGKSRAAHAD